MAAMMQTLNKSAVFGQTAELQGSRTNTAAVRCPVVVRAQQEVSRRAGLGMLAAGAALLTRTAPSEAAYGEAANIFGKAGNQAGFVPYAGEGYALLLPAKWNPSKERDFPGVDLRYEDNGDAVNNLVVISQKTDKKSITDFGGPDKFLNEFNFLLGKQVFTGETSSEGGFKNNKVSIASLLAVEEANDKKGKPYYKFEILTRTADGTEGGKHVLLNAAVGNGHLYILQAQAGDKRWFKGTDRVVRSVWDSFQVAWKPDGDEGGRHQLITAAVSGGNLYILKIQVGDKRWFKGVERDAKGTWNSFTVA